VLRVDRAVEAALPLDDHCTVGLDLADDTAISGPKLRVRVGHELDAAADPDARSDPRGKKTCADCIHGHVLRVAFAPVLPRTVESDYPFGEEMVQLRRTDERAGGSFELDG
jgi:hypothetical protein